MIPKIKTVKPLADYQIYCVFDDGVEVTYDVKMDMDTLPTYAPLKYVTGLFQNVQLDESRTCLFWNDEIDLPSDIIYEYGKKM